MEAMKKSIYSGEHAAWCQALREVRNLAGLTQRALAAKLKVYPSWVAKVEMGERRIDLVEFMHFVRACGGDAVEVFAAAATKGTCKTRGVKAGGN